MGAMHEERMVAKEFYKSRSRTPLSLDAVRGRSKRTSDHGSATLIVAVAREWPAVLGGNLFAFVATCQE
jgi:hypothetical protein